MSASATLTVRRLDANGDPMYGNGLLDFVSDLPAVAQIIKTALLLFQGEWWNDTSIGLPLFQQILGQPENNRQATIALLIQQVILSVEYVTALTNVQVSYTSNNRQFSYVCYAETSFGTVQVTYTPGNVAILPLAV
jgi:hypothetical protein